jgi:hypothetical protein
MYKQCTIWLRIFRENDIKGSIGARQPAAALCFGFRISATVGTWIKDALSDSFITLDHLRAADFPPIKGIESGNALVRRGNVRFVYIYTIRLGKSSTACNQQKNNDKRQAK